MDYLDFLLALIDKLTPLILGLLTYLGVKGAKERKAIRTELEQVAHSVNGMKEELVQEVRKASFLEGAKMESDKRPDVAEQMLGKAADIAKDVLKVAKHEAAAALKKAADKPKGSE